MLSRLPYELHRRAFEVTLALYRVTESLPKEAALSSRMRSKANDVFEGIIEYGYVQDSQRELRRVIQKMETLKGYVRIAAYALNMNPLHFAVLEREYEALENFMKRELDEVMRITVKSEAEETFAQEKPTIPPVKAEPQESAQAITGLPRIAEPLKQESHLAQGVTPARSLSGVNERQKTMIEYLRSSGGTARVPDFVSTFSSISTKTIQRDLRNLVERNIVQKQGHKKWTSYALRTGGVKDM